MKLLGTGSFVVSVDMCVVTQNPSLTKDMVVWIKTHGHISFDDKTFYEFSLSLGHSETGYPSVDVSPKSISRGNWRPASETIQSFKWTRTNGVFIKAKV